MGELTQVEDNIILSGPFINNFWWKKATKLKKWVSKNIWPIGRKKSKNSSTNTDDLDTGVQRQRLEVWLIC